MVLMLGRPHNKGTGTMQQPIHTDPVHRTGALDKVSTGVAGLDEVLHGGFPRGRPNLVFGGPGTGKTLLAFNFLKKCYARGEPAVFASFEQRQESIRSNARTIGFDLEACEASGIVAVTGSPMLPQWNENPEALMGKIYDTIAHECDRVKARHLILDGLDAYTRLLDNANHERLEVCHIRRWVVERSLTTLITAACSDNGYYGDYINNLINYNVDCSIHLFRKYEGETPVRQLEVIKYRGSEFRSGRHAVHLGPSGFILAPMPMAEVRPAPELARLPTGNRVFDCILYGGLLRGSVVMFAGPSGSGKTTFTAMVAATAAQRGERVLWLHLATSTGVLFAGTRSAGFDLQTSVENGANKMIAALPESVDAEKLSLDIEGMMQSFQPSLFVIDSVSACRRFGSEALAFQFLTRIFAEATRRSITVVVTYEEKTERAGNVVLDVKLNGNSLTPLVDTVIQLDLSLESHCLHRHLTVIKSTASDHSRRRHSFWIHDAGIEILARRDVDEIVHPHAFRDAARNNLPPCDT